MLESLIHSESNENDDGPIHGLIEKAVLRYNRSGKAEVTISGWLLYSHTSIVILQFALPGSEICLARKIERPDIALRFPDAEGADFSGFHTVLPLSDRSGILDEVYFTAILSNGLIIAGSLGLPDIFIQSSAHNFFTEEKIGSNPGPQNNQPKDNANILLNERKKDEETNSLSSSDIDRNNELTGNDDSVAYLDDIRHSYQNEAHARLMKFLHSKERIVFSPPESPKTTVIIPLHNRAEYTLDCLRSLSQSSSDDFEIIVVDNNSTDYTKVLLSKVDGLKIITNSENFHFLQGVNQGSNLASGEYLLILNNDACISPNAIQDAEQTLRKNGVGAVGGRIVKIDGKLQEAGVLLSREGIPVPYGFDKNPMDNRYLFERKVDYCSGVFLITKKSLFESLGGFDESFIPAYYEEVDYCLKLIKAGYEVRYDPRCLVLHVMYGSSSKAEADHLMSLNRIKLLEKHTDVLNQLTPRNQTPYLFGRSRFDQRKKILFIDDDLPLPESGYGAPRANALLKALDLLQVDTTFFTMTPHDETDWKYLYRKIPQRTEVVANLGKEKLADFLNERIDFYDEIRVSRPHNLEFIGRILSRLSVDIRPKITYDAESIFADREIKKLEHKKNFTLTEEERLFVIEKELDIIKIANKVSVVSNRDADLFRNFGFENVEVVSYGTPYKKSETSFTERKDIVFLGPITNAEAPNYDAVKWFIEDIFPILREEYGFADNVKFYGKVNAELVSSFANPQIHFEGEVDSLEDVYKSAKLFIAPMRIASGISIKVIEAASYGVPVITTDTVAELLDWEKQLEIASTSSAESFAYACYLLYSDKEIWESIRNNAAKRIQRDYSEREFINSVVRSYL